MKGDNKKEREDYSSRITYQNGNKIIIKQACDAGSSCALINVHITWGMLAYVQSNSHHETINFTFFEKILRKSPNCANVADKKKLVRIEDSWDDSKR